MSVQTSSPTGIARLRLRGNARPGFRWADVLASPLHDFPIRDEILFQCMPPAPGSDVLEVGPGAGFTAFRLARRVGHITLVDVAVLGHASSDQLGGASIGRAISFAGNAFGIGVAAALEPLAAQAVGAREDDVAWNALVASVFGCLLVWVPTSLLSAGATWLLGPMGIEPSLAGPARAFLLPHLPGMLAFSVFLAAKSFLQAHGRTAAALRQHLAPRIPQRVHRRAQPSVSP